MSLRDWFNRKNAKKTMPSEQVFANANSDGDIDLLLYQTPAGLLCGYRKEASQRDLLNMMGDWLHAKGSLSGDILFVPMDDFCEFPATFEHLNVTALDPMVFFKVTNRLGSIATKYSPEQLLEPLRESKLGKVYTLYAVPFCLISHPVTPQVFKRETSFFVPDDLAEAVGKAVVKCGNYDKKVFVSHQVQPMKDLLENWGDFRVQAEDALRDDIRYVKHIYDTQVTPAGEKGSPLYGFPVGVSQDFPGARTSAEELFGLLSGVSDFETLDVPDFNVLISSISQDAYYPYCCLLQPEALQAAGGMWNQFLEAPDFRSELKSHIQAMGGMPFSIRSKVAEREGCSSSGN